MGDESPADLAARYRAYVDLCNEGALDRLDEVVADEVLVNDVRLTREAYVDRIADLLAAFPDHHWDLRHLVVEPPSLAARFVDTGTHTGADWLGRRAAGARIRVEEHAFYRFAQGRIAEVWSTSDRLDVRDQLDGIL